MTVRPKIATRLVLATVVGAAALALALVARRNGRMPDAAGVDRGPGPSAVEPPLILGRREACLVCHAGITGLDEAHRPERIGCAACHGGDVRAMDARAAHAGMIRVPGNLADAPRTCAQSACHPALASRVERSIMATMAGVIEIDRRVFGDPAPASTVPPHAAALGAGPADTHLRQLCASCHLGQPKTEWGAIGEDTRGGGCNACHLMYDSAATRELATYRATAPAARTGIPRRHPSFSIAVGNDHCFGCHSRSGRISTNYEGWNELRDAPSDAALDADARAPQRRYRRLEDGRYFTRVTPDAHQARGMDCIDCHTPGEVMGAAKVVTHAREQAQIRCEDCHTARPASIPSTHADAETSALLALRRWTLPSGQRLAVTASGAVLSNVVVAPDAGLRLRHKRDGAWAPLRPPLAVCTQGGGHARLTCSACHSAWAPRCATCHTAFDKSADAFDHVDQRDVRGGWNESSGPFEATPPTLGVRADAADDAHPHGVVDTFIPGMILELDRSQFTTASPARVFRRLYARTAAHTTSRAARSCTSCHTDPVALGFGRGTLRYTIAGGVGRWSFTPELAPSPHDGLPADAWTGFLQARRGMVSTRDDVRPFTIEEQRRILTAGACLTCHAGSSAVMQRAIVDFAATVARKTKRCVGPTF
jgi:hypothetical protein